MKNFWYIISLPETEYKMLSYSFWSINFATHAVEPTFNELFIYEQRLRRIRDVNDGECYYLIPYSYNFATPMKGHAFYTNEEIKAELLDIRWEHNQ